MKLTPTASQTVGPYFHIGLSAMSIPVVAGPAARGARVTIGGRIFDSEGRPIPDALLETWQADAAGVYARREDVGIDPRPTRFLGIGRVATGDDGAFSLTTIKPGRVPCTGNVFQAPHLAVCIFMRGMLRHLVTRIYFPDEASNGEDPVLQSVDPERRATLIANAISQNAASLEWDIHCGGLHETVFFDV